MLRCHSALGAVPVTLTVPFSQIRELGGLGLMLKVTWQWRDLGPSPHPVCRAAAPHLCIWGSDVHCQASLCPRVRFHLLHCCRVSEALFSKLSNLVGQLQLTETLRC